MNDKSPEKNNLQVGELFITQFKVVVIANWTDGVQFLSHCDYRRIVAGAGLRQADQSAGTLVQRRHLN